MFGRVKKLFMLVGWIVIGLLAGCASGQEGIVIQTEVGTAEAAPVIGMANPAAVYCEGLGFATETVLREGGEDTDCLFPDGTRCAQWDFLAGRCGQSFSFCLGNDGVRMEVVDNIATCVFGDGSTCEEYQFFLGECGPGQNLGTRDAGEREAGKDQQQEPAGVAVAGWMGYVVSNPQEAQFDDYVVILPEGEVGSFGIQGADQEIEDVIAGLRDKEQPGKYAHLWGRLTCDVIDYGGCQLLVERIQVDGATGSPGVPDRIEGWQGTIHSLSYEEPGAARPDDYFQPTGDYPVQYGIDSAISADSGELELSEVIASLRDSDMLVTIWGEMTCGVPDAGGCHIAVYRIETPTEVYEITPAY